MSTNVSQAKIYLPFAIFIALAALILFVYWPVKSYDFIIYDDYGYVKNNALVQSGITPGNIRQAFGAVYVGNWHPLTMLSHMLDWELFGARAGGHHWTNVVIHIISAAFLFLLLKTLTGAIWRSAAVAFLFALHPINVESVAWISERKNVLSTFFWFVTTWFYFWYVKFPNWIRYVPVVASFCLGLMSKPMLVTLPFTLLLLDYWPLRRFGVPAEKNIKLKKRSLSYLIIEKVPLFLISAAASFVTFYVQKREGAVADLDTLPLLSRVCNAILAYGLYLRKLVCPYDLAVLYPFDLNLPAWHVILSAFIVVIISLIFFVASRRRPYLSVGWLWYLGTLFPVIGLVQVGRQAMSDRYALIPFVGLFIAMTWLIADLLTNRKVKAAATTLAIVCMAIMSSQQVKYWENTFTLFSRALAVTKNNAVAHSCVGAFLIESNKADEALAHLEKSLFINANDYNTLLRAATAYRMKGDHAKAMALLQKAINRHPEEALAYDDLFTDLVKTGKKEEALKMYRNAAFHNQQNPEIQHGFANSLFKLGFYDEAMARYKTSLKLSPRDALILYNLGTVMAVRNNDEAAVNYFKQAVTINPHFADAHSRLAFLLKKLGRFKEAELHDEKVARLVKRQERSSD